MSKAELAGFISKFNNEGIKDNESDLRWKF